MVVNFSVTCTCINGMTYNIQKSRMSVSIVDLADGVFLVTTEADVDLADGATRMYTHVLALHIPETSNTQCMCRWTCWEDDKPRGVVHGGVAHGGVAHGVQADFADAFLRVTQGASDVRIIQGKPKGFCIDRLAEIITIIARCACARRPPHTIARHVPGRLPHTIARHVHRTASSNDGAHSLRLLSHGRWFAMSTSQQADLVSSDTNEGTLLITSRCHDLLSNSANARFYEIYREVRPALSGHGFNSLRKFLDVVPGHLLVVPSFESTAEDAPLQMIKLELPVHVDQVYKSQTDWTSTTGIHGAFLRKDLYTGVTTISSVDG
jgi:hypothetical protein